MLDEDIKNFDLSELELTIIENALEQHYTLTGSNSVYKDMVWKLREQIYEVMNGYPMSSE